MKRLFFQMLNMAFFICSFMVLTNGSIAQNSTPPAFGDGSEANPYEIATIDNLYWLTQNSTEWDKHFIQTADIDATSSSTWDEGKGLFPIGDNTIRFSGKYNGKGHVIANVLINRYESSNIGLFGIVDGGIIDSIGLPNIIVNGDRNVGGIIGYLISGSVKNSHTQGTVHSISTQHYGQVGGFVAYNKGTIENCYASVNTSSNKKGVGGLIGINQGTVKNCYATGDVSGDYLIGGLIGQNHVTLINCYSTGKPTGINTTGGLIGYNPGNPSIVKCYWDTETSEIAISDGGTGLTTAQMKNRLSFNNWYFGETGIWGMNCSDNDGYPFLVWQGFTHDDIAPVLHVASLGEVVANCEVLSIDAPTATDDCLGEIVGVSNVPFPVNHSTEIIWRFDDTNGNVINQTQIVTISDETIPVPNQETLTDIIAACEVAELIIPTATDDNCAGQVNGVHNVQLPITSSTIITWTYTDYNGNSITQEQIVIIEDDLTPVPDEETLADISSECAIFELIPPTATDNCAGILNGVHDAQLPITTSTTITWTYTDNNGNSVSQTQNIQVTSDTTDPVPDEEMLADLSSQCDITELTAPTATDNCAGIINGVHDAQLPITSSTTITWTYTDTNGNSVSQTQNVEITGDTTDPVPVNTILDDITAECELTELSAPIAIDNCAGIISGVHDAQLPITSSTTIAWTYTDNNGNSVSQTQNIEITGDVTSPTLTCASNLTVNATSEGYYTVQGTELDPTDVDDNCGVASVLNDYNDAASLANAQVPEGTHTITWTVTDNADNTNTCSLDLTVNAHGTGVANLQQAGINLYPNPTAQMLTVELGQNKALRLTVTDLTGRVVLTKENPTQTETLDLSPLSNGVYLLVVQTNGKVLSTRVVKK